MISRKYINIESRLILLIGIVSYLYLYLSLLNKKYNIIFIYFAFLFIGYFTIGKNVYKYNLLIIIIDIINNRFIIKEGANFDNKFDRIEDETSKEDKANNTDKGEKISKKAEFNDEDEKALEKEGEDDSQKKKLKSLPSKPKNL